MKRSNIPLSLIVVSDILITFVAMSLAGCRDDTGSPQHPVELPTVEFAKIMDARGAPTNTENTPPVFVATLNNQSDWHITELEIRITNRDSRVSRTYSGDPIAYIIKTSRYDTVEAISPKSAGHFIFQIDPTSLYGEKSEKSSESIGAPYEWSIIRALGYKAM